MNPVLAYHEDSKHHLDRHAPGPGGLDWATQPDPFRRFAGAPQVDLPLLAGELPARCDDLFRPLGVPARAFDLDALAALLQLSLGLSAWKSHADSRWALRCNPSSGNLHPTEGYLISPALPGLAAGVYHYQPERHRLERRAAPPLCWSGGVLLALTGIHWREAWKHGRVPPLALPPLGGRRRVPRTAGPAAPTEPMAPRIGAPGCRQAIDPPSNDTPRAPKFRQLPEKPTDQMTKMG